MRQHAAEKHAKRCGGINVPQLRGGRSTLNPPTPSTYKTRAASQTLVTTTRWTVAQWERKHRHGAEQHTVYEPGREGCPLFIQLDPIRASSETLTSPRRGRCFWRMRARVVRQIQRVGVGSALVLMVSRASLPPLGLWCWSGQLTEELREQKRPTRRCWRRPAAQRYLSVRRSNCSAENWCLCLSKKTFQLKCSHEWKVRSVLSYLTRKDPWHLKHVITVYVLMIFVKCLE